MTNSFAIPAALADIGGAASSAIGSTVFSTRTSFYGSCTPTTIGCRTCKRRTYVSHPIDFALRNVAVYLVLGIVGFDPLVLLVAVPLSNISGTFSHCGADLKAGLLNYVLVTPEVHRWHHTAQVPEGFGFSCNYGVEFSFWDILFGTFYLPKKEGETLQPERIGHPGGTADEPNYLKLLLVPLGLYPRKWFKRAPTIS